MKIVSIIEATTVNAVAKGAIEFLRTSRELSSSAEIPAVEGSFVTFDRHDPARSENEFVSATRAAGIEIDVISERGRFDLKVIPELRRIIEERQPNLVITHSVKSHFLMWRSGLGKKYPWLAFHHGYTATDRKMRTYNRLDRWALPKADRMLTVCQAFARELAGISKVPVEKILVQHNAIRPKPRARADVVQTLREKLGIANHQRVILAIGRLSKEKAHADLIEAFDRLLQSAPQLDCRLVIVGDGPERGKLEGFAHSSSEPERIILAGSTSDVQPFYALADVFVLPSHSEGSPNVLLEAMAAGVPVVATEVGGVPEIVSNEETALLVPARDTVQLATAIARVLTESQLAERLTASAANLIATRHTPETYAKDLLEIYEGVLQTRRERS